jgi:hypothetical protein
VTEDQKFSNDEQKLSEGIHFGVDINAAVVIVCKYSQRREMAERLFSEYRDEKGLTLIVPACGLSVCYQAADRIPIGWNTCGCGKHAMVKWMEGN